MKNQRVAVPVLIRPLAVVGGLLGLALAAVQSTTAPYDELTNTYRSVTNFNVETVRGMHMAASGRILMLNTHGSTLDMWVPGGPLVTQFHWPTLNNPIAVDAYTDTAPNPDVEYALVLGGGTHALALHDLSTGRITATLQLPAETGDVVVDQQNSIAFVSCPGDDTVRQIALPALTVDAIFTVASQRPRFLFLDPGPTSAASDNSVFVTPELSGNNTISINAIQDANTLAFPFASGFTAPLDLKPFLPGGLPDDDLFEMTPQPPPSGAPPTIAATSVLRNAGTILEAHGRNPVTGDYWIVGTDALNTNAFNQPPTTEPSLKGVFARNQLTIASTLGGSPLPWSNTTIDLDLVGTSYDSRFSIGSPYALAFHPSGYAAIAGATTDQIRAVDTAGARVGDLELPPGSIPRGIVFDAAGQLMLVYCWGTNEVRVYGVTALVNAMAADPNLIAGPTGGYILSFKLGADPTDARIKHGRELFYDADNSLDGRTSCNTCHPGGGMDVIGWNIQDFPHDHKDLMVTQSLKSIEDTFPYHWRGERDLEAFNGAFAGLLGGTELDPTPGGDFDDFKAFVFSLQAHANPIENIHRELDPALSTLQPAFTPPTGHAAGDPIAGQTAMDVPATLFGRFSCTDCHGKPAGTVGDPQNDDVGPVPGNLNLDVAHFRQLRHKQHDVVRCDITVGTTTLQLNGPRGGYGLSHDGDHVSIFDFLNRNPFAITDQQERDLAAFVEQADQGITPAAHLAYYVDANTSSTVLSEIDSVLIAQTGTAPFAADHWVSVALIGSHQDASSVVHDLTWYFVSGTNTFFASDPTVVFPNSAVGSQTWTALKAEAAAGRAKFTILGVPPGNALRFAIDPDDDGLADSAEATAGTDRFDADTDGDGDPDGHEAANGGQPLNPAVQSSDLTAPALTGGRIDHTGASYAKLVLTFSEPVTLHITATNSVTGHVATENRFVPRGYDSVTVQRLEASLPAITFASGHPIPSVSGVPYGYSFSIQATDLGGNTTTVNTSSILTTRDQLVALPFDPAQGGGSNIPPALLSRTVENLQWVGTPGTGPTFQAAADVKVRFDVPELVTAYASPPNTPNGSSSANERQVVAFQVLHFDSTTQTWSVVPSSGSGMTVSAPTNRLFSTLLVRPDPSPSVPTPSAGPMVPSNIIPGPFLLSTASNASGAVTFDFTLSQTVPTNDEISLNVIGVLEQDTRDSPPPDEFWLLSMFSWNKPNTKPENRAIQSP